MFCLLRKVVGITVTSHERHGLSLAPRLHVQFLVQTNSKGNIQASHYWPVVTTPDPRPQPPTPHPPPQPLPVTNDDSPHKGPITRKLFPCHEVIISRHCQLMFYPLALKNRLVICVSRYSLAVYHCHIYHSIWKAPPRIIKTWLGHHNIMPCDVPVTGDKWTNATLSWQMNQGKNNKDTKQQHYTPKNIHTARSLLFKHYSSSWIFFGIYWLGLRQSYDCPSAAEVTLTNMNWFTTQINKHW